MSFPVALVEVTLFLPAHAGDSRPAALFSYGRAVDRYPNRWLTALDHDTEPGLLGGDTVPYAYPPGSETPVMHLGESLGDSLICEPAPAPEVGTGRCIFTVWLLVQIDICPLYFTASKTERS